jgi:hypothetical protein
VSKLLDRLTGRAVRADVVDAIVQWSAASRALLDMLSSGSVITASDRDLVVRLVRSCMDSPNPPEL